VLYLQSSIGLGHRVKLLRVTTFHVASPQPQERPILRACKSPDQNTQKVQDNCTMGVNDAAGEKYGKIRDVRTILAEKMRPKMRGRNTQGLGIPEAVGRRLSFYMR